MEARIEADATREEKESLWTATYLLMGLKYTPDFIEHVLKGVFALKESSTYRKILEEGEAIGLSKGEAIGLSKGEAIEARNLLMRLGQKRFGPPSAATIAVLESTTLLEQLEQWAERLLEVESWEELLRTV